MSGHDHCPILGHSIHKDQDILRTSAVLSWRRLEKISSILSLCLFLSSIVQYMITTRPTTVPETCMGRNQHTTARPSHCPSPASASASASSPTDASGSLQLHQSSLDLPTRRRQNQVWRARARKFARKLARKFRNETADLSTTSRVFPAATGLLFWKGSPQEWECLSGCSI